MTPRRIPATVARRLTTGLRDSSLWRLYRAGGLRHRPRGPLAHPHNEWSVIHAPVDPRPSDRLLDLSVAAIEQARNWSLHELVARQPAITEVDIWPGEHYRLLPALAQTWGARHVVEIGTYRGASALAFATAPSVERIVTFDVVRWDDFDPTYLLAADFETRIEQRIADLSDPGAFAEHRETLMSADVIFVDAPKDGVFEPRFFDLLLSAPPTVDQLLVIDDIRVLTMIELWRNLGLDMLDLTSFGHWSGTGLVVRPAAVDAVPDV